MLRSFCSDSRSGKQNQPSSTLLKMDFCVRVVWFDLACGTWSQNLNLFFFWENWKSFLGSISGVWLEGWGFVLYFPPFCDRLLNIWNSLVSFLSPMLLPSLSSPWQLWAGTLSWRAQVLRNDEEGKVLREEKWDQLWTFKSREAGTSVIFQVRPVQPPLCPCLNKTVVLAEYLFWRTSVHHSNIWNMLGWKTVFAGGEGCVTSVRQRKTGFWWFLLAYMCMVIEYNWSWRAWKSYLVVIQSFCILDTDVYS